MKRGRPLLSRIAAEAPQRLLADAEKFHAMQGALQQRENPFQFRDGGRHRRQRRMRKLEHHVAQGHAFRGRVERDPVVRHARPRQHQMTGRELADIVAHEDLAARLDDQVQLVLVMIMPAHQRIRKAVLQVADETETGLGSKPGVASRCCSSSICGKTASALRGMAHSPQATPCSSAARARSIQAGQRFAHCLRERGGVAKVAEQLAQDSNGAASEPPCSTSARKRAAYGSLRASRAPARRGLPGSGTSTPP